MSFDGYYDADGHPVFDESIADPPLEPDPGPGPLPRPIRCMKGILKGRRASRYALEKHARKAKQTARHGGKLTPMGAAFLKILGQQP